MIEKISYKAVWLGIVTSALIFTAVLVLSMYVNAEQGAPPPGPGDSDGGTHFSKGDWIIEKCDDVHRSNQTINLNGNLEIKNGGKLTFKNVTLRLTCQKNGQFRIILRHGGEFNVFDSSQLTSNATFLFDVEDSAKLNMQNSTISKCGFDENNRGLATKSSDVQIYNCSFTKNYYGIYCVHSEPKISDTKFSQNTYGMSFDTSNLVLENCTFDDNANYDFKIEKNSNITLLNTTFNRDKVNFMDKVSTLKVEWFLDVEVKDEFNNKIQGADVKIEDKYGALVKYKKTDSNGLAKWLRCIECIVDIDDKRYYTPHTITAEKDWFYGKASVTMNESKKVTIIIKAPDEPAEYVIGIIAKQNPFSPNNDGFKDITSIIVEAKQNQKLYLNIYDENSDLTKQGIVLTEIIDGVYEAFWDGTNVNDAKADDGIYEIRVSNTGDGNQKNENRSVTGSVILDTTPPKLENASVTPNEGTELDLYTFTVDYEDESGLGILEFKSPTPTTENLANDVHPRKAVDSEGDEHVVWMSDRDGQWEIYYKELRDGHDVRKVYIDDDSLGHPFDIQMADIDGDGDKDAVVALGGGREGLVWYEAPSDNPYNQPWIRHLIAKGIYYGVYVEDIDGDGDMDIVTSNHHTDYELGIFLYLNDGTGHFPYFLRVKIDSATGQDFFIADIADNGDSNLDIVATLGNDDKVVWYKNDGSYSSSWTRYIIDDDFDAPWGVYVVDINRDGYLDVVSAAIYENEIRWYDGSSPSWTITTVGALAGAHNVFVADIDLDTDLDIVATGQSAGRVMWFENTGGVWNPYTVDSLSYARGVYVAQIIPGGNPEIVAAGIHANQVVLYSTTSPTVSWTGTPIDTDLPGSHYVYVADIDSDGNLDVAATGFWGNDVVWYPNSMIVEPDIRISDLNFHSVYPSIALDSDDNAHVVWVDKRNLNSWEIYYSKVQDDTCIDLTVPDYLVSDDIGTDSGRVVMIGSVVVISDSGEDTKFLEHPDIDVDWQNNIHIVWSDARDSSEPNTWQVYYQVQTNSAIPTVVVNDIRISSPTSTYLNKASAICPVIAVKHDYAHIAWQDNRDDYTTPIWEIYYEMIDLSTYTTSINDVRVTSGTTYPFYNDAVLDGYNSAKPDIAVDDRGVVRIVYMDKRETDPGYESEGTHVSGNWEVYQLILDPLSTTYWPGGGPARKLFERRISDFSFGDYLGLPDGHSMYPRIAVSNQLSYITWHDDKDENYEIYYTVTGWVFCSAYGNIQVTNHVNQDMYPDIAFSNIITNYGPDIKWQSDRNGNWDIFNSDDCHDLTIPDEGGSGEVHWICAYVDNTRYPLYPVDPKDKDASDGITYGLSIPLEKGYHSYYFSANDALTKSIKTKIFNGPHVKEIPSPELSNTSISPVNGTEGTIFTFNVTYTDKYGIYNNKPQTLDIYEDNDQVHPRKAIDDFGYVHVVYMDNSSGHWEIKYALISPSSTVLTIKQISDEDDFDSVYPSIVVDSCDSEKGYAHVVWIDCRKQSWEIYYSKVKIDRPSATLSDLNTPDICISDIDGIDSGRVVTDIFGNVIILDSGENTLFLEHPDIDMDSQKNIHIVWSDARNNTWQIYYQMQDSVYNVLIDDTKISNSLEENALAICPVVSCGIDNYVHIAWQDNRDYLTNIWEIYYEMINPYKDDMDGSPTFDSIIRMVDDKRITSGYNSAIQYRDAIPDGYNSTKPDIDVDSSGRIHIVYMDQRPIDPGFEQNRTHIENCWEVYSIGLKPIWIAIPTLEIFVPSRLGWHTVFLGVFKLWEKRQSDMILGSSINPYGLYTGPGGLPPALDNFSMYPRIAVCGDYANGISYITWHDYKDGNWEIYYTKVPNNKNIPQIDIRVTYRNDDMYPDIACINLRAYIGCDIKWQRNYVITGWDIINKDYVQPSIFASQGIGRVIVIIDGIEYKMQPINQSDISPKDGIQFSWSMPLEKGEHEYSFWASNGISSIISDKFKTSYVEPTILPTPKITLKDEKGKIIPSNKPITGAVVVAIATDDEDEELGIIGTCSEYYDGKNWTLIGIDYDRSDGWSMKWDTSNLTEGSYIIKAVKIFLNGVSENTTSVYLKKPIQAELLNPSVTEIEGKQLKKVFRFNVTYKDENFEKIDYLETLDIITPFDQVHPRKAVDNFGNVHVVYMDNSSGHWEINYTIISSSGMILDTIQVSDNDIYDSVYPSIALDSRGSGHVVWVDCRKQSWEIYYSKVVWTGLLSDLTVPDVLISANDGIDSGRVVKDILGNVIIEDDGTNTLFLEHPDIYVDLKNNVHIVWSDARNRTTDDTWQIYYQMQDSAYIPSVLIDDTKISNPPDDEDSAICPVVAVDNNLYVHIAWQDSRCDNITPTWEIFYEMLDPRKDDMDGDSAIDSIIVMSDITDDRMVTSGYDATICYTDAIFDQFDSAKPDIGVDNDNVIYITYMDKRLIDPGHEGENTHSGGNTWEVYTLALKYYWHDSFHEESLLRIPPYSYEFPYPRIVFIFKKLWEKRQSDMYPGGEYGYYYLRQKDEHSMYPRIALRDRGFYDGQLFVTWHDYRAQNWEIYFTKLCNYYNYPEVDYRVSGHAMKDMYPDVAIAPNEEPDFKWQSNRYGDWDILNADTSNIPHVYLYINNKIYDMYPQDFNNTNPKKGIFFTTTLPLTIGNFSFHYEAPDSISYLKRTKRQNLNVTGEIEKPLIIKFQDAEDKTISWIPGKEKIIGGGYEIGKSSVEIANSIILPQNPYGLIFGVIEYYEEEDTNWIPIGFVSCSGDSISAGKKNNSKSKSEELESIPIYIINFSAEYPLVIQWNYNNISDGNYPIRVMLYDTEGNMIMNSTSVSINRKIAVPEIDIISPKDGEVIYGNFTISAKETSGKNIRYAVFKLFIDNEWFEVANLTQPENKIWKVDLNMTQLIMARGILRSSYSPGACQIMMEDNNGNVGNAIRVFKISDKYYTPSLSLSTISLSNSKPKSGDIVQISTNLTNNGYREETIIIIILVDNRVIDTKLLTLNASKFAVITTNWVAETGKHKIAVNVIYDNETLANATKIIEVAEQLPDLVIKAENIFLSNSNPKDGENVTIFAIIKNSGKGIANNVLITFYMDNNSIYNATISSIAHGEEKIISFEWIAKKGEHKISVKIDGNNKITETNEGNNEASLYIKVSEKENVISTNKAVAIAIGTFIAGGALVACFRLLGAKKV